MRSLAQAAAASAGYAGFEPDACLINRFTPSTRLSLHQDRDEANFAQPIVSVSLGLPAVFLFGGLQRSDSTLRVYPSRSASTSTTGLLQATTATPASTYTRACVPAPRATG
jgi:DNA alkylation damage repair protein AlkB